MALLHPHITNAYTVVFSASGDADLDGFSDRMVVLKKKANDTTVTNEQRPLLLLLGQEDGSFKEVVRNDEIIDSEGAFGDPLEELSIEEGTLFIKHGIAGGQHWNRITTFRYDKEKEDWFLMKEHFVSYSFNDSRDPDAEALVMDKELIKTKKDFGLITLKKYSSPD